MFENTIYHQPAIQVKAVDTTGAGDCFDAGFIKAWLDGKPIEECLLWGNIVAGYLPRDMVRRESLIDTNVVEKDYFEIVKRKVDLLTLYLARNFFICIRSALAPY